MSSEASVDCEKFDRIVLDLLYDELDELTAAAARRHREHCTRCGGIESRLRATRELGALSMVPAPAGLTARILAAERQAHAELGLRQRFGRAVSVIAGYAMRPQLAMAALLLLMVGSSLLFLRARPGERDSVQVTERGVPEIEAESAVVAVTESPAAALTTEKVTRAPERKVATGEPDEAASEPVRLAQDSDTESAFGAGKKKQASNAGADDHSSDYDAALAAYRRGHYAEAEARFEAVASAGGEQAASASLFAAQSAKNSGGCPAAVARFDTVHARYPATSVGYEAAWQAATCYRALGQIDRARKNYATLASAPGYSERAQRALAELNAASVTIAKPAAAAPPAAARSRASPPVQPQREGE